MTKQEFVTIVNGIKDTYDKEAEIENKILSLDVFEAFMLNLVELPCFKALEQLLLANFSNKDMDLIYWWIFDSNDKIIFDSEGNEIANVECLEDLYDYLKG